LLLLVLLPLNSFAINESKNELRVISISPAVTEIICDLNGVDNLVGVSNYCRTPKEVLSKVKVGGFLNPSLEKIISLVPDYVIVSKNSGTYSFAKKLNSLNIKIVIVEFYSLEDIKNAYLKIGDVLGEKKLAQEKISLFNNKIQFYKEKLKDRDKKLVSFLRWKKPLTVAAKNTLEDELINIAGGKNVVSLETSRYPVYSMEAFIIENPEIIIDGSYYKIPSTLEKKNIVQYWSKWSNLKAVKSRQIYILKTDFHSVPGPRTLMLLDELVAIINPDVLVLNEDLSEKINI